MAPLATDWAPRSRWWRAPRTRAQRLRAWRVAVRAEAKWSARQQDSPAATRTVDRTPKSRARWVAARWVRSDVPVEEGVRSHARPRAERPVRPSWRPSLRPDVARFAGRLRRATSCSDRPTHRLLPRETSALAWALPRRRPLDSTRLERAQRPVRTPLPARAHRKCSGLQALWQAQALVQAHSLLTALLARRTLLAPVRLQHAQARSSWTQTFRCLWRSDRSRCERARPQMSCAKASLLCRYGWTCVGTDATAGVCCVQAAAADLRGDAYRVTRTRVSSQRQSCCMGDYSHCSHPRPTRLSMARNTSQHALLHLCNKSVGAPQHKLNLHSSRNKRSSMQR